VPLTPGSPSLSKICLSLTDGFDGPKNTMRPRVPIRNPRLEVSRVDVSTGITSRVDPLGSTPRTARHRWPDGQPTTSRLAAHCSTHWQRRTGGGVNNAAVRKPRYAAGTIARHHDEAGKVTGRCALRSNRHGNPPSCRLRNGHALGAPLEYVALPELRNVFRARREIVQSSRFRRPPRQPGGTAAPYRSSFRGPGHRQRASATEGGRLRLGDRGPSVGKDERWPAPHPAPPAPCARSAARSNSSASAPSSSGRRARRPASALGRGQARSGTGCGDGCAAHRRPRERPRQRELERARVTPTYEQPASSATASSVVACLDRHRFRRPAPTRKRHPIPALGRVQRGHVTPCTVGACCTARRSSSSAANPAGSIGLYGRRAPRRPAPVRPAIPTAARAPPGGRGMAAKPIDESTSRARRPRGGRHRPPRAPARSNHHRLPYLGPFEDRSRPQYVGHPPASDSARS